MKKQKETRPILPREEWPYEVPENWVWTRLEHIAEWGSGGTPSRKRPQYYKGSIPWIKTGELNDGRIYDSEEKITQEALKNSSAKIFPIHSVMIAMYGATIGKTAILEIPAASNQACACAIPIDGVDYLFLFYFLRSQKDLFIANAQGGAQPNISQTIIKRHYFPLPPLPEQQRIVARIESLFSKLDAATEKIRATLDTFPTRKATLLHKAFTGELTKKWRKEHGVGMDSWKKKTLKDFLLPMTRKLPNKDEFRYIDIDSIDNKKQVIRAPKIVLSKEAPSRAQRELKNGDVLFSLVRPYLKNIAIIDEELSDCIASTGFYVCRSNENMYPRFLYHKLCYDESVSYITQFMKGDNSPSVRSSDFLSLPVFLPTLPEQQEIIRILDAVFEREQAAKENAERLLTRIALTKKSILARAFRGKLGTNDPKEASAETLLKTIKEDQ